MAAAGPQAELAPLVAKLREEGVFVRDLSTLGIAYHSPALDPFCGRLRTRAPSQTSKALLQTEREPQQCKPARYSCNAPTMQFMAALGSGMLVVMCWHDCQAALECLSLYLLAYAVLGELVPEPKPRSKAWLSTSFPLDSADPAAAVCGPDYHVPPACSTLNCVRATMPCYCMHSSGCLLSFHTERL